MGSAGLQHPHSSDLSLSSLAGHRPSIASGDSVQLKEANDVVCVGLACVDVTSRPVVDTAEQTARLHLIEEVSRVLQTVSDCAYKSCYGILNLTPSHTLLVSGELCGCGTMLWDSRGAGQARHLGGSPSSGRPRRHGLLHGMPLSLSLSPLLASSLDR